jgi:membrane associated rhomboid family serine protease
MVAGSDPDMNVAPATSAHAAASSAHSATVAVRVFTGSIRRLVFCRPMEIHSTDPGFTSSQRARGNFRLAVRLAFTFVAILWLIQLLISGLDLRPENFGVRPRQFAGLIGILFAPVVHGDFAHLFANSPPLLIAGTAMLYLYPQSALRVLPAIYFGPGLAVWLLAAGSSHIGASGLVYGLVAYILIAGLIRRDRRAIAASLLISFMYGTPQTSCTARWSGACCRSVLASPGKRISPRR